VLAKNKALCKKGSMIALQSAKDPNGHLWWIAEVASVAYQYTHPNKSVDGFKYKKNAWYMDVYHYDRMAAAPNDFSRPAGKNTNKATTINVEGLMHVFKQQELKKVHHKARRGRSGSSDSSAITSIEVTVKDNDVAAAMNKLAQAYLDLT
jgi:hypothetical protein